MTWTPEEMFVHPDKFRDEVPPKRYHCRFTPEFSAFVQTEEKWNPVAGKPTDYPTEFRKSVGVGEMVCPMCHGIVRSDSSRLQKTKPSVLTPRASHCCVERRKSRVQPRPTHGTCYEHLPWQYQRSLFRSGLQLSPPCRPVRVTPPA